MEREGGGRQEGTFEGGPCCRAAGEGTERPVAVFIECNVRKKEEQVISQCCREESR